MTEESSDPATPGRVTDSKRGYRVGVDIGGSDYTQRSRLLQQKCLPFGALHRECLDHVIVLDGRNLVGAGRLSTSEVLPPQVRCWTGR
jgi:hypothetical protein